MIVPSSTRIRICGSLLSVGLFFFDVERTLAASPSKGTIDFSSQIRPILSAKCFHCHGADEGSRKAKLRLDIRDEALKPGKSGDVAIVPGDVSKSALVKRILTTDEDDLMPPPKAKMPLTEAQKDILKRWVADGPPKMLFLSIRM